MHHAAHDRDVCSRRPGARAVRMACGALALCVAVAPATGCKERAPKAGVPSGTDRQVSSQAPAHPLESLHEAKAFLAPTRNTGNAVSGEVWFREDLNNPEPGLEITLRLQHLKPDVRYAVTLHEFGDLSTAQLGPAVQTLVEDDPDTATAVGLLTPVTGNADLERFLTVELPGASVGGTTRPILGRTLAVREWPADAEPGEPLAVGVVGRDQALTAGSADAL
ncbi:MAG: hypothetical protein AAF288_02760 [Planctomycetota bacterium]